jgi:hypothetical protein
MAANTSVEVVYTVKMGSDGDKQLLNYLADRGPDGAIPPAPAAQECAAGTRYRDNCVLLAGGEGSAYREPGGSDTGEREGRKTGDGEDTEEPEEPEATGDGPGLAMTGLTPAARTLAAWAAALLAAGAALVLMRRSRRRDR